MERFALLCVPGVSNTLHTGLEIVCFEITINKFSYTSVVDLGIFLLTYMYHNLTTA